MNGPHKEFDHLLYHPLVSYKYPHDGHVVGEIANDRVHSAIISSDVDEMPATCDIVLHQLI